MATTIFSCFSIVSLYGTYLRRSLSSAGLSPQTIDLDDETTIHFWGPKSRPDTTSTTKPTLVFIHGFGPDAIWQWGQQAVFFAREFSVYVPSLVFFGDSTSKSPERSEVFQAVSLGKLMEKLGVKSYSVVGTSYGGFVAYRMAVMWPERVEKVVIASSGVNLRYRDNVELVKDRARVEKVEEVLLPGTAAQLRVLLGLAFSKRRVSMPDFLLNDVIRKLYSKNRKEKMELLKGLTLGKDNIVNLAPLHQALGEKARLEVIKKTAHVPQIENPGQFNSIVYKFLLGRS